MIRCRHRWRRALAAIVVLAGLAVTVAGCGEPTVRPGSGAAKAENVLRHHSADRRLQSAQYGSTPYR